MCALCWRCFLSSWLGLRFARAIFHRGGWARRLRHSWAWRRITLECCGRASWPSARSAFMSEESRGWKIAGREPARLGSASTICIMCTPPIWIYSARAACSNFFPRRARAWEKRRWRSGYWRPRCFPQFAQPRIVVAGQQTAHIVFERIEPQRPLRFREILERPRIRVIVSREQSPQQTNVHIHQRIQRTCFANRWKQPRRTYAQNLGFNHQRSPVGSKPPQNT